MASLLMAVELEPAAVESAATDGGRGASVGTLSVDEIYRAHAADVTRWVSRLGGPGVDLEDLVQEVFVLVQRHLGGYRGEAKLTTWLYRIAANVVLHHRRRERWRRILRRTPEAADGTLREPDGNPEENVAQRQARELIYRALDGMNERYRTALILFEIEDLPGEEVAELLGIKSSNLWVLLHRARAELVRRVTALRDEER